MAYFRDELYSRFRIRIWVAARMSLNCPDLFAAPLLVSVNGGLSFFSPKQNAALQISKKGFLVRSAWCEKFRRPHNLLFRRNSLLYSLLSKEVFRSNWFFICFTIAKVFMWLQKRKGKEKSISKHVRKHAGVKWRAERWRNKKKTEGKNIFQAVIKVSGNAHMYGTVIHISFTF